MTTFPDKFMAAYSDNFWDCPKKAAKGAPKCDTMLMKAFRSESKKAHPDRAAQNGMSVEQATERMQAINQAKDVLMNEILAEGDADE